MLYIYAKMLDVLLFLFIKYNEVAVCIENYYTDCYDKNQYLQIVHNATKYSFLCLYCYYKNYQVEPFKKEWINSVICFNNDIVECYKSISEIDSLQNYNDSSCYNHIFEMYMMKYKDHYIYKHTPYRLKNIDPTTITAVQNPFFSVNYKDLDSELEISIELPKNIFISGNEICSFPFLKRWFTYNINYAKFNSNYELNIFGFDFNSHSLDASQYILLSESGFTVEKIK